jgi:hypothetical protein
MTPAPKRRWFSFSLRTLFVVVTASAAAIGYLTWKAKLLRERNELIETLRGRGAIVWFAHEKGKRPPVPAPGPDVLRRHLGKFAFAEVTRILARGD